MNSFFKSRTILFVFFTMHFTCCLTAIDSVASQGSTLPLSYIKFARSHEAAAWSNANIDRIIISQGVKGMINETSQSRTQNSLENQIILQAKKDLAHRLSIEVDKVNLREIRAVTWPDSSLGCPKPGKVYSQASQEGYLIRLEAKGRMYFYHSAGTLNPFLCEETSRITPHPSKIDEFIPPPDSEID